MDFQISKETGVLTIKLTQKSEKEEGICFPDIDHGRVIWSQLGNVIMFYLYRVIQGYAASDTLGMVGKRVFVNGILKMRLINKQVKEWVDLYSAYDHKLMLPNLPSFFRTKCDLKLEKLGEWAKGFNGRAVNKWACTPMMMLAMISLAERGVRWINGRPELDYDAANDDLHEIDEFVQGWPFAAFLFCEFRFGVYYLPKDVKDRLLVTKKGELIGCEIPGDRLGNDWFHELSRYIEELENELVWYRRGYSTPDVCKDNTVKRLWDYKLLDCFSVEFGIACYKADLLGGQIVFADENELSVYDQIYEEKDVGSISWYSRYCKSKAEVYQAVFHQLPLMFSEKHDVIGEKNKIAIGDYNLVHQVKSPTTYNKRWSDFPWNTTDMERLMCDWAYDVQLGADIAVSGDTFDRLTNIVYNLEDSFADRSEMYEDNRCVVMRYAPDFYSDRSPQHFGIGFTSLFEYAYRYPTIDHKLDKQKEGYFPTSRDYIDRDVCESREFRIRRNLMYRWILFTLTLDVRCMTKGLPISRDQFFHDICKGDFDRYFLMPNHILTSYVVLEEVKDESPARWFYRSNGLQNVSKTKVNSRFYTNLEIMHPEPQSYYMRCGTIHWLIGPILNLFNNNKILPKKIKMKLLSVTRFPELFVRFRDIIAADNGISVKTPEDRDYAIWFSYDTAIKLMVIFEKGQSDALALG